ncbi:hypothetical protein [Bradyrhizobium sp. AZCC 1578]|uniref:hypothetical protein n=2 Tax=Bradyrhizobium TaxID=374 RepID=UPI002FF3AB37
MSTRLIEAGKPFNEVDIRPAHAGTFELAESRRGVDPAFAVGSNMEKAAAYAISAFIVGFGLWILIAGLSSSAPALWICAGLIPIVIGLISAFGPT